MSLVESRYLAANMGRIWVGPAPISLCKSVTACYKAKITVIQTVRTSTFFPINILTV